MKWYLLFSSHIQEYNDYFKHLSSEKLIEIDNYIDDYYQKHINNIGLSTSRPDLNPFRDLQFLLRKRPKDLYIWLSKISRHLIVSPKLHDILNYHEIYGTCAFKGINLKNKLESRSDYYAYLFYRNMWDNLDFSSSRFVFKDYDTRETLYEVQISNSEEYEKLERENGRISGKIIGYKDLVFQVDKYYDLFYLFNIDEIHPFVSERLCLELENSGLKGLELSELSSINIELHVKS